jgi:IS4 transposase
LRGDPLSVFDHARFEPFADQSNDPLIGDPMIEKPEHPPVIDFVEGNHDTLKAIAWIPARAVAARTRSGEVIWILSTLPNAVPALAVMGLYRLRWQIELLFVFERGWLRQ